MREMRTKVEIEANQLDLELFRLIGRLEAFAEQTKEKGLNVIVNDLYSSRPLLRRMMHRDDQKRTQ